MNRNFARFLVVILTVICSSGGLTSSGELGLQEGQRFEIIGTLYAHGVRDDLGSSEISIISVVPLRLSGPEIVFRKLIPVGSTMTIVGKAPKKLFHFLYPDRYIVQISALDAPTDVPIVIDLSRGIEGKPKTLNPAIFKALP
ncbi:hypothetical protein [Ramlibacter sp.]|uniref:hypothetical protein n=1 Tax=Ramlibacter sp. TaxID=1917967 RepID=UPI002B657B15|nr:hypothetical protein [Ramlibacter sp.]HWI82076.1 hypothetical protein [Ramlibacter sp.]